MGDRDVTPGASVCKQSERHGTDGRMTEGRGGAAGRARGRQG